MYSITILSDIKNNVIYRLKFNWKQKLSLKVHNSSETRNTRLNFSNQLEKLIFSITENFNSISPRTNYVPLGPRKYHSVSCMAESVMLCFVQGFEDNQNCNGSNDKEAKVQTVKNKFLRKSR